MSEPVPAEAVLPEGGISLDDFGQPMPEDGGFWPCRLFFGYDTQPSPRGSFETSFPRLELVLSGRYPNLVCGRTADLFEVMLEAGDALFIPADCWNKPAWDEDVGLLSLLFGATHLGVSLLAWDAGQQAFTSVDKRSCLVPGNSPLYHMVEALACLQDGDSPAGRPARLQAKAVIEYAKSLLRHPLRDDERQAAALYRSVCVFLEENFGQIITREKVAREFGVSPNYLSRVFADHGSATFSDFLISLRIGKAKLMLEKFDLPLAEVAQRCGFHDPNYFFKVFKKRVKRTPTQYRTSVARTG